MLRAATLCALATLTLFGCQTTAPSRSNMWAARGDAALASDPGRALANYQRAGAARDRADVPELQGRQREAAAQWLHRELQARTAGEAAWSERLAVLAQVRRAAREHGVLEQLEPALAPLEQRAWRMAWDEQVAALLATTPGPWEAAAGFAELAAAVPAEAAALRLEANAEAARRAQALRERLEGPARHPVVQARLLAAAKAQGQSPAAVALPAPLALRVGWTAEATGCSGVDAAVAALSRSAAGHRGSMRLTATCEATPRVESVTRQHTTWTERKIHEKAFEETCRKVDYGGQSVCTYRDTAGRCASWSGGSREECTTKPVTRTRTERVPITTKQTEQVATVATKARGTLVVEVDGASRATPFEVTGTVRGESVERALAALARTELAALVTRAALEVEKELLRQHLTSLSPLLAAGDDAAAEEGLVVALAAGATRADVPSGFARLAARDLLSFEAWLRVVVDERGPSFPGLRARFAAATSLPALSPPDPDEEGRKLEAAEDEWAQKVVAERKVHRTADAFKFGFTAAPTHWYTYGGDGGLGLNGGIFVSGGGPLGSLPLFYFYQAGLTLEAAFLEGLSFGINGLARFGAGLRSHAVWLAPFLAGGASSRQDVIPWGAELGLGLRLAVRVGRAGTLELLAERISRPLTEGTPQTLVAQRLHYELRYVHRTADEGEFGVGLGCAFHQRSGKDLVLPLNDLSGRLCDATGFLAF